MMKIKKWKTVCVVTEEIFPSFLLPTATFLYFLSVLTPLIVFFLIIEYLTPVVMVALQWTPCPCTSLDRFLMCHPEAVAGRSRGVNEWLETWRRYMKTECVFMVTGWDKNSCIMLSAAFAVWLPCFLSKIPWSAFCLLLSFFLVFLLAVSQRWLRLNFAICVKKKKVQVGISSAEASCGCSGGALWSGGEEEEMMWGQSVHWSLSFVLEACWTNATHFFGLQD